MEAEYEEGPEPFEEDNETEIVELLEEDNQKTDITEQLFDLQGEEDLILMMKMA